jgi:hypothetical protein
LGMRLFDILQSSVRHFVFLCVKIHKSNKMRKISQNQC